jgi:lipopolysaccharide export system ATP-binding protein
MLLVKNIGKTINGRHIVENVSFSIARGEIVGLLGPNGAGKSTSFYMTLGLVRPDYGHIYLDDNDISNLPPYKRARLGMIYLPQESSIFQSMTVAENIIVALEVSEKDQQKRMQKLEQLLEEFNISHLYDIKGISLSGGERRRVEIARCLASNPSYILLDEPFAGIDPISVSDIKHLIIQLKNKNIGILITDHNVKDALSLIERGYVIYQGQVLAHGTVAEIIMHPKVKQFYLGDNFSL